VPDPLGRFAFGLHVLVGVVLVALIGASGALGPLELWGVDAWAYWSYDPVHPYVVGIWGSHGAYVYAPPFAQLLLPGQAVPWPVFLVAWTVLLTAVAVWLAGRFGALAVLLPPVTRDIWYGNIHLLLGAAVVLGFRRPWTWAFVLLTKVTPGVGLLWFVGRRDWRSLGIALGATAAIIAVSWVLAPWMWSEWIAVLLDLAGRPAPQIAVVGLGPLWLRVVVAGVVAFVAGARGLRWPLVLAVVLAMPSIWFHSLAMLLAMLPLVLLDRRAPLGTTSWRPRRAAPEPAWSVSGGVVGEAGR
jgi:hypothetical protein